MEILTSVKQSGKNSLRVGIMGAIPRQLVNELPGLFSLAAVMTSTLRGVPKMRSNHDSRIHVNELLERGELCKWTVGKLYAQPYTFALMN